MIPPPDAKYATVVIDPPWPSNGYPMGQNNAGCELCRPILDKNCRCRTVHNVKFDYPLMSLDELVAMDIPALLEPDAFVFLWTINRFVRAAFDLVDSWGLEYMCMMAWVKPHGPKPVGYPIYNMEPIIVARQGRPKFLDTKDFRTANLWDAPRNSHAAPAGWGRQIANCTKPDGLYNLLRRVTPAPRLDMFARRRIDGFDAWGNQVPDETEAGRLL